MRPTAHAQSALSHPLNTLLGTEANVRVLRILMLSDIPIGVSELARLALLQPSGVARVCARLEDLGVIEAIGRGERNRQFRRAPRWQLAGAVMNLFVQERAQGEAILGQLRNSMSAIANVRAAWIEGSVATGSDRPGESIVVSVLTDSAEVDAVRQAAWARMLAVQEASAVSIELRVHTIADLRTMDPREREALGTAIPLYGPPPLALLDQRKASESRPRNGRGRSHAQLDLRSREFGQAIADKIRKDPSIIEQAKRYVEQRFPAASPGEHLELTEWRMILTTMSASRIRRLLVQDDARAIRLRQSLPFLGVLTAGERNAIMRSARRRS